MSWKLKYGMGMNGNTQITELDMPIDESKAIEFANSYLSSTGLDEVAENEAVKFYGYYTMDTLGINGKIAGMLGVNAFTGQV